jgi:hypothetical protein
LKTHSLHNSPKRRKQINKKEPKPNQDQPVTTRNWFLKTPIKVFIQNKLEVFISYGGCIYSTFGLGIVKQETNKPSRAEVSIPSFYNKLA